MQAMPIAINQTTAIRQSHQLVTVFLPHAFSAVSLAVFLASKKPPLTAIGGHSIRRKQLRLA